MTLEIIILLLSILITALMVWLYVSRKYTAKISELEAENKALKMQSEINENVLNSVKLEFSKIAQESLKNQQEQLLSAHSLDLVNKFELFKSNEINPINKLLHDFKESIDNYQKSHALESLEIKNAVSTAEKYAKALTTNQNTRGEFGEDWIEQIFKFSGLCENVHYTKQFVCGNTKPDFVVNLPDDKHVIIDSKVILKNFLEYCNSDNDENLKKAVVADFTKCINELAKKNYEEIDELHQPGFIIMFVPIEPCINLIYTDYEFKKIIELANSKNIIIAGTASLIVTLRLINQLWASKTRYDNVQNIIAVGENLYNNIATHAQKLVEIRDVIENAYKYIQTEINRFTERRNGSVFKEAEKLKDFGIEAKTSKSGKKIIENDIPRELLAISEEV
ncbi:DNA recombination protein RmuC [bacterium]|nr:DNA recombination protein RmuC [bacterium]